MDELGAVPFSDAYKARLLKNPPIQLPTHEARVLRGVYFVDKGFNKRKAAFLSGASRCSISLAISSKEVSWQSGI